MNYCLVKSWSKITSGRAELQHQAGKQQSGHYLPNEVYKNIRMLDEPDPKKVKQKDIVKHKNVYPDLPQRHHISGPLFGAVT